MKKFLYQHRKLFLILAIPYLLIIALAVIKIDYNVTCPAGIDEVDNIITIDNDTNIKQPVNVVSVYSYSRINLLSYLIGKCYPFATVEKSSEYENFNYDDLQKGGTIQKKVSIYNSIIAGYKAAGYQLNYDFYGYIIHYKNTFASKDLQIGDIITNLNGYELTNDFIPKEALRDLKGRYADITLIRNWGTNQQTTLNLQIEGKEFTDDNNKSYTSFGFSVYPYNIPKITSNIPNYTINWQNINSIGPSGGLMQSFYVYEMLTGGKLSKNIKIAGTGTVDINGNAGLIGGITQKIYTCELSKVDIFIVPVTSKDYKDNPAEVNYIDALNAYNKLKNPHMKIYVVWSLEEMIKCLNDYQTGGNV